MDKKLTCDPSCNFFKNLICTKSKLTTEEGATCLFPFSRYLDLKKKQVASKLHKILN